MSMSPSPHVHLQEWDKNSPSGFGPAVFCSGSFRTNGLCNNMFSLILIHLFPDPCGNFCYVLRVDLYSVLDIGDQLITYTGFSSFLRIIQVL